MQFLTASQHILILVFILCTFSAQSKNIKTERPNIKLKTLLDTIECREHSCFLEAIEVNGFCVSKSWSQEEQQYFRHKICNEHTAVKNDLVVMFAILSRDHFNSSILSHDQVFVDLIEKDLVHYQFKLFETDDVNGNQRGVTSRTWYHSEQYPNLSIMWEVLYVGGQKQWHVGLVWKNNVS